MMPPSAFLADAEPTPVGAMILRALDALEADGYTFWLMEECVTARGNLGKGRKSPQIKVTAINAPSACAPMAVAQFLISRAIQTIDSPTSD